MGKNVAGVDMKYNDRENDRRYITADGKNVDIPDQNSRDEDFVIINGDKVPRDEVSFDDNGKPVRKVVGQEQGKEQENER